MWSHAKPIPLSERVPVLENMGFRVVDERIGHERDYPLHICLRDGRVLRHENRHSLLRKDGRRFSIQDSAAPIRDRDGTIVGTVKAGPMTYARFSTDDRRCMIRGYVGEGEFTRDKLTTFGGAGVVKIPRLQELLRHICTNGFEHHVAGTFSHVAAAVHDATTRYMGWDVHHHQ